MQRLENVSGLGIRQAKEWGEILTGVETKNKYQVVDQDGASLFYAAEVGGSWITRIFLKSFRPFTVKVVDHDNQTILEVRRPFRFIFHEADILNAEGQLFGKIIKKFTVLRRVYSVTDATGAEICQLFGPLLKPWTFQIKHEGIELGTIHKKWSGLGKEALTNADNFGIEFPSDCPAAVKAIFLGAVFLIDFVHFENTRG